MVAPIGLPSELCGVYSILILLNENVTRSTIFVPPDGSPASMSNDITRPSSILILKYSSFDVPIFLRVNVASLMISLVRSAAIKAVYDKLTAAGHAKGLLVFGATITPFGGNSYYTVAHESVRQQVNTYVKSGAFDGYIDFDAAVTDGGNPPKLQATLAAWSQMDGLHPGPAGYKKMGEAVDLTLFTK